MQKPDPKRVQGILNGDEPDEPAVAVGTLDLHEFKGEVLAELTARFKDPVARKAIPGTGLLQLATLLVKLDPPEPEPEETHGSVLELVQGSTLTPERKREVLLIEQARLRQELAAVTHELDKEENDGS